MNHTSILIGAHVSSAKSLHLAFARGESIGCTTMQIFTKSSRTWDAKPLTAIEIEQFIKRAQESPITNVVVHAGYLINLCSSNPENEQKSIASLIQEIERCAHLNIKYLVLHPGSHLGAGEKEGTEKIAHNLNHVLKNTDESVSIVLETTAGQGTNLGYTFEQLRDIRNLINDKKRIGICLDTCHIFCAGYDISTPESYKKTINLFDEIIGLSHLKVIHINGTKDARGSRTDRHSPIQEGKIPLTTFELFMNDHRLIHIPKILETPANEDMILWKKEIALLKKMSA